MGVWKRASTTGQKTAMAKPRLGDAVKGVDPTIDRPPAEIGATFGEYTIAKALFKRGSDTGYLAEAPDGRKLVIRLTDDLSAAPEISEYTPHIGLFIGNLIITRLLGEGGMGAVYLAEDKSDGTLYAVKIINAEMSDANAIRRFVREAVQAARVHDGVATVVDAGITDTNQPYITMEYVRGKDLSRIITENGNLDIKEIMEVLIKVCDIMGPVHEQGILHRDLKLENIMVIEDGKIKVIDWGIVKPIIAGSVTAEGSCVGTPYYMSPEAARAETLDQRADIYSLGVIAYVLLTGNFPYTTDSVVDQPMGVTFRAIDPDYLLKKPSDCISDDDRKKTVQNFDNTILRALAKKRQDRITTMAEFKAELITCAKTAGIEMEDTENASPEIIYAPVTPGTKKRLWIAPVVMVTSLALGLITGMFSTPRIEKPATYDVSITTKEPAKAAVWTRDGEKEWMEEIGDAPIFAPFAGGTILVLTPKDDTKAPIVIEVGPESQSLKDVEFRKPITVQQ